MTAAALPARTPLAGVGLYLVAVTLVVAANTVGKLTMFGLPVPQVVLAQVSGLFFASMLAGRTLRIDRLLATRKPRLQLLRTCCQMGAALCFYMGLRAMPLADDAPARALQVMFVLRELRAGLHFNALSLSGITPIEAHMLNKGRRYAAMFGWPEPYADGADKKDRYAEIEHTTNRRMAELVGAALDPAEADELARLTTAALATLKANVPR